MKAILIARVSTEEQKEAGNSLPAQIARLEKYCKNKNFEILKICSFDESAYTNQREEFDKIIDFVINQKEKVAVCCDKVDRISRNIFDTRVSTLYEKALKDEIEMHFVSDGQVLTSRISAAEKFQFSINLGLAKYYSDAISDNVKRAQEQKLRKGEWLSKAIFGYKNITLSSGKKDIEVDSENAPYVIKMFELYATGIKSFQTVADEMNRLGLKNSNGNPISPSRVEQTLKNSFYYGIMKVNGEYHKHKYPPLISETLFKKVQSIMSGHNKAHIQYANKPMLLRGLIVCNRCGCTVSGDIKKNKYVYYSCSNSKRICKRIWIKEEVIVNALLETFDKISLSDEKIQKIIDFIKQSYNQQQEFLQAKQQALCKELDQIQNRLSKLVDMHLDGTVDADTYKNKMNEYKNRQREITSEMQSHVELDELNMITVQKVLRLAKLSREIFESSNIEEKQQLLRFVYSNLKLDGENLLAELKEPFFSMEKIGDQPIWLGRKDSNLRMPGPKPGALPLGYAPT